MGQGGLGQAGGTVAGGHALRRLGRNTSAGVGSRNNSTFLKRFLIGTHAAVAGLQLLTRDSRRYRTYFPSVAIIAPVRR